MARVLLLLPTATYRAADFLTAARTLGAEVVVASERRLVSIGDAQLTLDLRRPEVAAEAIAAVAAERPLDAVVAVDDQGVRVAALAAERLGLSGNPLEAAAATRDKAAMRRALAAAGVPQPEHRAVGPSDDPAAVCRRGRAALRRKAAVAVGEPRRDPGGRSAGRGCGRRAGSRDPRRGRGGPGGAAAD